MNYRLKFIAVLGVILLVFAWWGLETAAGQQQFDEMAGMIPFGSGLVGALLLFVSAAILLMKDEQ